MSDTTQKIAILGGTFDPVHMGHIKYAKEAADRYDFTKVLFIPTGNPPHKVNHIVTSPAHRLKMVELAMELDERFEACDIETKRTGDSYTIDTLEEIHKKYPGTEVFYLIGTDVLYNIAKWKESHRVFELCSFICASRQGTITEKEEKEVENLGKMGCKIQIMPFEPIEISSTELREIIKSGVHEDLIPEKVMQYMKDNDIYGNRTFPITDEEIQKDLKDFLLPERYEHSLGVMEEAVRIGKIYGADLVKCKRAGLLHDCGKNLNKEQLKWLGFGENPTKEEIFDGYNRRLLHAQTGVVIARERYGVRDEEILDAIRNHITGKPEMSLLSCIIFLADFTEKGREGQMFEEARRILAEDGLYSAMLYECQQTIKFVLEKGERLDINTIKTRNWLISLLNDKN